MNSESIMRLIFRKYVGIMMVMTIALVFIFEIVGYYKDSKIFLYSPDKSQCITIIDVRRVRTLFDKKRYRYIIDGKHNKLPESNYMLLDIENVSAVGGEIYVCWKNEDFMWHVTMPSVKIVESKIDTVKYNFNTSLPLDPRGFPSEIKFRKDACAIFVYSLMSLSPNTGAIVELE